MRGGGGRGQLKLKLYPTSQFFQNFSKILQQQKSLSALQKQNQPESSPQEYFAIGLK
jgi:hypothetical protein